MSDFNRHGGAFRAQIAAKGKRGSALMVVIGFLAFMIVSAVAFSIYMRAERLPSSALRRTVASRQLAKAALAEAIARVDDSLRGSPFPGLLFPADGQSAMYTPRGYPEHWEGRIFMPPRDGGTGNQTEEQGMAARVYYAPANQTVSVPTLEGLGYVPAPLVNDVRFLGRSTYTAKWKNLPYDAGRFAFVAINVSDYFDINRMRADIPRTSNSDGRISLSYLFDRNVRPLDEAKEQQFATVDNFSNLAQFDSIAHEGRPSGDGANAIGSDAPYVSMLDFNLAYGSQASREMQPPFYRWIDNNRGGSSTQMYTSPDAYNAAARQPFITESCATNEKYQVDIATLQGQPFGTEVRQDNVSFMTVNTKAASSKFFTPLRDSRTIGPETLQFANGLQSLSMIAAVMYDYLDHNDVPASLAWPCVERVPMFATVEPSFAFNIPAVQAQTTDDTTVWMFNPNEWLRAGMLSAVYAFPFRRNGKERNDTFKAQAIVRIFLAPENITLSEKEGLGMALRPQTAAQWTQKANMFELNGMNNVFCLTFKLDEQTITLPDNIEFDEQAGGLINFPVNVDAINNAGPVPIVTKKTVKNSNNGVTTTTEEFTVNVSPLGKDGKPLFPVVGTPIDVGVFNGIAGQPLRPYVCVWMRIINGDGKTVDLVPAVIEDDNILNGGSGSVPALAEYLLQAQDGPLLRFQGDKQFNYSSMVSGGAAAGGEVQWDPKSFCALDPRFNWAPEDWYDPSASMTTFKAWLDKTKAYIKAHVDDDNNPCDSDIFCAVSNQGLLQSLGEFAFLPRLTDVYGSGVPRLSVKAASGGYDGVVRKSPSNVANVKCAWRSYEMNRDVYSYFKEVGIGRSTSRECLVNPYTPDMTIMMAALANTPCDYWAAGGALNAIKKPTNSDTKDLQGLVSPDPSISGAANAVQKYAFSSKNSEAYLQGRYLREIAETFQSNFRSKDELRKAFLRMRRDSDRAQAADVWEEIWDRIWGVNADPNESIYEYSGIRVQGDNYHILFGKDVGTNLYGVDRKFLYSYWRDCFANKQQLFLIFVRAESSAIGGPGEGTPGQKGARAVALVWRNPVATVDGGTDGLRWDTDQSYMQRDTVRDRRPHQTRVLFYHQFD